MAVAPSVDLIVWRPVRAPQQQTPVPHLSLAKGRATCLLLPRTQEGRKWVVQWIAVFSTIWEFDPHSSCLVTAWGLFRAGNLGLPHLVVSWQAYPLSPRIGQLYCPSGPCRGWSFPPHPELRFHHLALVTKFEVWVWGQRGNVDTHDARKRVISHAQSPRSGAWRRELHMSKLGKGNLPLYLQSF